MGQLAIVSLGTLHMSLDTTPLTDFNSDKARALLTYLAVESDRAHHREHLAGLLWPEYPERRARHSLSQVLYSVRTVIGDREAPPSARYLDVTRQTLQFRPTSDYWLDVDTLNACHDGLHQQDARSILETLEEAIALYRGPFLAGFSLGDSPAFEEWTLLQRERLERLAMEILGALVEGYSDQGTYDEALHWAWRQLDLDPWREDAHRQVIRLLALNGQHAAALAQYERCRQVLQQELQAAPDAETVALIERIQTGPPSPSSSDPLDQLSLRAPTHNAPAFLDDTIQPVVTENPVFVGREPELARLTDYLNNALAGHGQAAFIIGGPGRGKTALMRAFAEQAMAEHPDLLAVWGACNATSGVGDAYLPFREAVGMLTGDVESRWQAGTIRREQARRLWSALPVTLPALVAHGPYVVNTLVRGTEVIAHAEEAGLGDTAWMSELRTLTDRIEVSGLQQQALFQQVTHTLQRIAKAHPLILMLDDLQWADQGSIGLLLHLGRRLIGKPILVLGAYRPEELRPFHGPSGRMTPHPLTKVLNELKRQYGDVWIDLQAADEARGAQFVNALLAKEPNRLPETFSTALHARTGGHPLFTIELLRALQARGDLHRATDGAWVAGQHLDWDTMPARVEAVIEERLGRLSREQRDLLAVASVEGETFTAQAVADVQGLDERTVLQTLTQDLRDQHRLVCDQEEVSANGRYLTRFAFVHALFQEHLYQTMSLGEQRLLHGELGVSLEALYSQDNDRIVPQLAHHFHRADRLEKAIEYEVRAGEQARQAYANDQAKLHYERALNLLERIDSGKAVRSWHLTALSGLGKLCLSTGEVPEAERYLREAIARGKRISLDPQKMAILYHWLGESLYWQGKYEDILPIGEEGLALIEGDRNSLGVALINQTIAAGCYFVDRERGERLTRQTATFIQDLPYVEELRILYNHIILMYRYFKEVEKVRYWLNALEQRARAHGDLVAMSTVHLEMASLMQCIGDTERAIENAHRGLKTVDHTGDIKYGSWFWGRLAYLHLNAGRLPEAKTCAQQALHLSLKVGFNRDIVDYHSLIGRITLSCQDWKGAIEALTTTESLYHTPPNSVDLAELRQFTGRAYLGMLDTRRAHQDFDAGLQYLTEEENTQRLPWTLRLLASLLSGLEETTDDPETFKITVERLRKQISSLDEGLTQWSLEPVEKTSKRVSLLVDAIQPASPRWSWHNSFKDCTYQADPNLTLQAANARHLWQMNRSAPRLTHPLTDIANGHVVQVSCEPALEDRPAIGGLLLWRDNKNYLWLEVGRFGERDVAFGGCLDNEDLVIGRGRLPDGPEPGWAMGESVTLQMVMTGDRVDALGSLDGEAWFSVGHTTFPFGEGVQVGVHAIGMMDRSIYPGAYPEGTAIQFSAFRLWETPP
jgi:DNA-binding SARP family transcriptional activator